MSWERINTYLNEAYGHLTFKTERFYNWSEGKNLKTWSDGRLYNVLNYLRTGRSTIGNPDHKTNFPPHIDHVSFFKTTTPLKVWLVFHPYKEVDDIRVDIENWCYEYDLIAEFFSSEYSWYNDNTCMVVVTTK